MKNLFLVLVVLLAANVSAQYITLDKDGYTNVRQKPNAKSAIVEKVKKHQVFYKAEDIPCADQVYDSLNVGNWLAITTNMEDMAGYIYKRDLFAIDKLPSLKEDTWIEGKLLRVSNDSLGIDISITFQPYSEKNKLQGKRMYGTDGWEPHNEIKEIRISNKGNVSSLPINKFKNYYDVRWISAWLGFDGEIYILLSGGDGSGGFSVMLSVLDGDILYSLPIEC